MSHNLRHNSIYPVTMVPQGDDGKAKPFHVLRCMSQPACEAELLLSPGATRRLPPHAIVKFAHQKGWLADRRGYCLCPDHTPWAKRGGEPSDLPPAQRRAAYCSIRERNMAAAANDHEPIREKERNMDYAIAPGEEALSVATADRRIRDGELAVFRALLPAIARADFSRGWRARCAATIGMNETTFSSNVKRLVAHGYLAEVPHSHKLIVRKQATKEEAVMTDHAPPPEPTALLMPVIVADPPPEPALADNRRIRAFLDDNYDEGDGRWCGDLSDAAASERLSVPRAWVTNIRAAFYGDDVNEAADQRVAASVELADLAAKLQEDALNIAARAEDLERRARGLFGDAKL